MIVATKNYERNAKNSFRDAIIPHGCTKYKIPAKKCVFFSSLSIIEEGSFSVGWHTPGPPELHRGTDS